MLRFAILGFGFMGKKHGDALQKTENAQVNSIIDNHYDTNSGFDVFQSLDFFLQQPRNVDIVVISTPNFEHFSSAKALLESGYHIVLDKPYCFTKEEAEVLQETAKSTGKTIYFVNQNRFSGTSKFLKKLIEENKLGEIYFVQTNCFWSRNERYYIPDSWKGKKLLDGGTLYTQFFHFLDLLDWTFGIHDVKTVQLHTFRHKNLIEIEDTGTIGFELKTNQAIAQINFSTAVYEKNLESSMTIIAENGTVKIAGQYFNEVEFCSIKDFEFNPDDIEQAGNEDNLVKMYTEIVQNFPNNTSEKTTENNFNVIGIIEKIYS